MGRSSTAKKSEPRDAASKLAQQRLSVIELARELGTRKNPSRKRVSVIHWSERDKEGDHGTAQPFRAFGAS